MLEERSKSGGETIDEFFRGRVRLVQSRRGFRFAVDAPLLADFVEIRPGDEVCELGTGNGAAAVFLSLKAFRRLTAVEIQPALAALARRNVVLNRLEGRVEVVEADLRSWTPGRRFDVVFSNPPYLKARTGFLSASPEKSAAKHELSCDIRGVMKATAALLKPEGRAYFIFRAAREDDFRQAAGKSGLYIRAIRRILPKTKEPAGLFLARLGFHEGAEDDLPPLVLHDEAGGFTAEAKDIFEGVRASRSF
jgi:tRNA1(Val) A37 N6-methylase TrmN6